MMTRLPGEVLREVLRRLPKTEFDGTLIQGRYERKPGEPNPLISLAMTSRALRLLVYRDDEAWADLSRYRCGYVACPLQEVLQHAMPEVQVHWTLRWVLPYLAAGGRAAYARPTIKPVAGTEELSGGSWAGALDPPLTRIDCERLTRVRNSLCHLLAALETDITDVPEHLDVVVVPSNERMLNPGWGAMDSVERKCGSQLIDWVRALPDRDGQAPGVKICPGEVVTSAAFGNSLQATWLVHAVGIPWHLSAPMEEREAAVREQVDLFGRIFRAAAVVGASSIAIPAALAGDRFPPAIMAAIAAACAVREMLASGGCLKVALTGHSSGPVKYQTALFEIARQQAARCLVCCEERYRTALDNRVHTIPAMQGMHRAVSSLAGMILDT